MTSSDDSDSAGTSPLRRKLLSGELLYFSGDEPAGERTILAEWIREAACEKAHIHLRRAVISGDLNLQDITFEDDFSLVDCEINGDWHYFSHATFKRNLKLSGSTFHGGAVFNGATVVRDAELSSMNFVNTAFFTDMHVSGTFSVASSRFHSLAATTFNRSWFERDVFFRDSAFESETWFADVHIGGSAFFKGATFGGAVSFVKLRAQNVYFTEGSIEASPLTVTFEREAIFNCAEIGGDAVLEGVRFKGRTSFHDADFRGSSYFRGARFGKGSSPSFTDTRFQGTASFRRAIFQDEVEFRSAQFQAEAILEGTTFEDGADFRSVRFHMDALFGGSQFNKGANFRASHFNGLADFSSGKDASVAVFNDACFEHARFEHDARFDNVVFRGETSFRDSSFVAVSFARNGTVQGREQFQGGMDLRGCTYERIEVELKSLLERLTPYNRQPYRQLTKVLRAVGRDRQADEVYLERRRVEHRRLSLRREPFRWLGDWLYRWVANYGVRPYRLIGAGVSLLCVGTVFFSLPGAVRAKDEKAVCGSSVPIRLSYWDAFGISLHQFLPVEVPMGSQCVPSEEPVEISIALPNWTSHLSVRPTTFSTFFLRLAGWVLVPLGVAALSGLLRRAAP